MVRKSVKILPMIEDEFDNIWESAVISLPKLYLWQTLMKNCLFIVIRVFYT